MDLVLKYTGFSLGFTLKYPAEAQPRGATGDRPPPPVVFKTVLVKSLNPVRY